MRISRGDRFFHFISVVPRRYCLFSPLSVSLRLGGLFLLFAIGCNAQRAALLTPEHTEIGKRFAERLAEQLAARRISLTDAEMAATAFRLLAVERPFNLTASDAKAAAAAIGCDFLILIGARAQARVSFSKGEYYEAFAAIYLVSGRTGRLADWRLNSFEATSAESAERSLLEASSLVAARLVESIKSTHRKEISEKTPLPIESVPADIEILGKTDFRPPLPYQRIKPKYTPMAYLYDVRATVDIEADIGADGAVLRTEIVRWAGYGLDESVTEAVRQMNWRPAMRNGKSLPMRVLLRYNFVKADEH